MSTLPEAVDLLVVGGGISGAGCALQALRRGVPRVLLVERDDFAHGSSSRSSKLVHGGLRYLKSGQVGLTRESLREREQLLRDVPGLVRPLRFALPHHRGQGPAPWLTQAALRAYDLLAGRRTRARLDAAQATELLPALRREGLLGLSVYEDAGTDDARLTLRVLQEARARGAVLAPRTALLRLERDAAGAVQAAWLRDAQGFERRVVTRCVLACGGAWAARVGASLGERAGAPLPRMRPLRGSHLLLDLARLPLPHAVAWSHPEDGRPVFAYPWMGRLLLGTTDVDHPDPDQTPRMAPEEQRYLLAALAHAFPHAGLGEADIVSRWAGVRPVLDRGAADPSRESREHWVQADHGLVSLTGGKLSTFRAMADTALHAARPWLPALHASLDARILSDGPEPFGPHHAAVAAGEPLLGLPEGLWRHVLQHEQVQHLDDLLLRRTRVGLLARDGAQAGLSALQPLCAEWLGWDDARWRGEVARYAQIWREEHAA